ncbi:MAG: ABC transporter permease [Verrucomicrobiales bacterium]|jgi:putative ABC transport system permease protein|nr:ABC transporter permease [Verrucomicrobiales bacterium]
MNRAGLLHLGLRYLAGNRAKTSLLVAAFTLVWLLPSAIGILVGKVETHLRSRAMDTPLVLGSAGSALELTFNALHFTKPEIATLTYRDALDVSETGLGEAIPVYARFTAGDNRIVGTTFDYFRFRDFSFQEGRAFLRMGECVIGSAVATANGIREGDAIISSPETLFDLAGVYPLRMTVCGILDPTGTPDDDAVFVDLKTTWVIEGLGHGHKKAAEATEEERLTTDEGGVVRLNASVLEYNEITPETIDSFHFHGEPEDNPITAAIVIPAGVKEQALLKGRYTSSKSLQLVTPTEEMDELFATVFSVQRAVIWMLIIVGGATLALGALTFMLSYRLRHREFVSLRHLGASPGMLRGLIAFEAVFVLAASLLLSGGLLLLIEWIAPIMIERYW